jgi:hypothetical protein
MKNFIALSLAFLSFSSFSIADSPAMSEEQKKRGGYNINQHVGAGLLLALYFCEHKAWPENLDALHGFGDKKNVPMPDPINWERFSLPGAETIFGEQVVLKTPGGDKPGDIPVSSTHIAPECDNEFKPEIKLHIGA